MKKSFSVIISLIFAFSSTPIFAQFSQNRLILIKEKLNNACSKKPVINLDYEASDMPIYSNISYKELISKGDYRHGTQLYGLYTNNLNLQTKYKISQFSIEDESCYFVSEINFIVKVVPNIYIANEAAQFPCMKQKVYEHEMQHHQYFMNALHAENQNFQVNIKSRLNNIPVKYHQADVPIITDYIQKASVELQDSFIKKINSRKSPYDKLLDDPNNTYKALIACKNELSQLNKLYQ